MSATDILEQYPVLQPGNEVHLTLRGGILFADRTPYMLNHEQADFLERCDGVHTVKSVLPRAWTTEYGDWKFLAFVLQMVNAGRLRLLEQPFVSALRVTGSRSANIPPHMSIELTVGCNLNCRHCYRESESTKNYYMPTNDLLNILQRLAAAGLRSVELTGGEPLLHRDFIEILENCAQRFEMVGVLSNGTLMNDRIAETFQAMRDRLLLSISLDGSTAAAHDLRRGSPGAFERTTGSIRLLTRFGVKVRVSMCVDEDSFSDVENTLQLARDLGAIAFSYTPVLPLGRGRSWAPQGWNLDGRHVKQVEAGLVERYKGFLTVIPKEAFCNLEGREGCGAGYRTFAMDPWGYVRPCATYGADHVVIGNLREQTVEELFGHPVTAALAELPLPSDEICGDCSLAMFCRYCGLRGFHGSEMLRDCSWVQLPAVQRVFQYWRAGSGASITR